jgi:hypothetical protein
MLDWIRTITLSRGGEESMLNPGTDVRKSPALFFMCGRGERSGLEAVLVRLDMSYRSVLNCIQFSCTGLGWMREHLRLIMMKRKAQRNGYTG